MRIETLQLTDLTEDPANARTHPERNMAAIKASLERFGQRLPLLVRDGQIVAGNGRLRAMRELGWTEARTVDAGDMTEEEARAFAVADNRTSDLAEWDSSRLHAVLQDIPDLSELLQFDTKELRHIEFDAQVGSGEVEQDEVPEPPKQAVTKLGEVWTLGRHTVVCGDSWEQSPLIENVLIVTDIPYNIADMTEDVTVKLPMGGQYTSRFGAWDCGFDPVRFVNFWMIPALELRGSIYVFCAGEQVGALLLPVKPMSGICSGQCIWYKTNPTPSVRQVGWRWSHENIAYARSLKAPWSWAGQTEMVSVWSGGKSGGERLHPTQKPVWVIAKPIEASSTMDGLVVDPFLGSGTTLIAAEQLGRVCYGIEIEPRYVDVTIERWQTLTGGKAVRKSS